MSTGSTWDGFEFFIGAMIVGVAAFALVLAVIGRRARRRQRTQHRERVPQTHRLVSGLEACWEPLPGNRLRMYGWTDKPISVGDYILLPNGNRATRYKLLQVRRERDPDDMWFGEAEFAPRIAAAAASAEEPP